MVSSFLVKSMMVTVLLMAAPAWAQTAPVAQDGAAETGETALNEDTTEVRQLLFMEQAFEEAVKYGIRVVEQQLPPFAPGLVFFAGPVQARGFRLDGYGVFFDVEFPVVRRSILWSMRTLSQFDRDMAAAMQDLRRAALEESFGRATPATQPAVPVAPVAVGSAGAGRRDAPRSAPVTPAPPAQVDPQATYLAALRTALADVLVTYGETVSLDGEEWLTVAARDGRGRIDPASVTTGTVTLRIRGRDLAAVRDGRLSRQEALARVETP